MSRCASLASARNDSGVSGILTAVYMGRSEIRDFLIANGAVLFAEYGCIEIVESWEDNVPIGQQTDFRRAVDAQDGEKIVFSWQVWPDKASFHAAEDKMHEDGVLDRSGEPPFDAKRLIAGCFAPVFTMGRD